jgi:hypothetical protein
MASPGTFGDSTLPPELDALVQAELASAEQLLWVGQPSPRRYLLISIPIVLFAIPWTGFAVFWVLGASGILFGGLPKNAPGPAGFFACFPLFGLPFILVGLGMLSSPYWLLRKARRTCYALTDRRAIIWEPGIFGSVSVRSYGPAQLTRIRRNQRADGSGDMIFEEYATYDNRGHRSISSRGFMGIERVREIEELLRKALLSKNAGNP